MTFSCLTEIPSYWSWRWRNVRKGFLLVWTIVTEYSLSTDIPVFSIKTVPQSSKWGNCAGTSNFGEDERTEIVSYVRIIEMHHLAHPILLRTIFSCVSSASRTSFRVPCERINTQVSLCSLTFFFFQFMLIANRSLPIQYSIRYLASWPLFGNISLRPH